MKKLVLFTILIFIVPCIKAQWSGHVRNFDLLGDMEPLVIPDFTHPGYRN